MKAEIIGYYTEWQKDYINGLGLSYVEWLEHKKEDSESKLKELEQQLEKERDEKKDHAQGFVRFVDDNRDLTNHRSLLEMYELFITQ